MNSLKPSFEIMNSFKTYSFVYKFIMTVSEDEDEGWTRIKVELTSVVVQYSIISYIFQGFIISYDRKNSPEIE